jgi:hypothetical protein
LSLDQGRVEHYKKDIINAYAKSNDVSKILDIERVQNTDGQFRKIGLKTFINWDVFDNPSSILVFSDFGSSVARGETKYLIDQAMQLSRTRREIDRTELSPQFLGERMTSLLRNDFVLLAPITLHYELFLNESVWEPFYDSRQRAFTIKIGSQRVRLLSIHEDFIDNNVIGLNGNFGRWKATPGDNNSGLTVTIQVAQENVSQVELVVSSLVKFEPVDPMSISVVHVR